MAIQCTHSYERTLLLGLNGELFQSSSHQYCMAEMYLVQKARQTIGFYRVGRGICTGRCAVGFSPQDFARKSTAEVKICLFCGGPGRPLIGQAERQSQRGPAPTLPFNHWLYCSPVFTTELVHSGRQSPEL